MKTTNPQLEFAMNTVPSYFNYDKERDAFKFLGMDSKRQIRDFFRDKAVLDVGSGLEIIAGTLHQLFRNNSDAPSVINLNPQFADELHTKKLGRGTVFIHRPPDIAGIIRNVKGDKFADDYFKKRKAIAGLVQALPFRDGFFDSVVSMWAFPECFYEFDSGNYKDEELVKGYKEIQRVLKVGGTALLSPIRGKEERESTVSLLGRAGNKNFEFFPSKFQYDDGERKLYKNGDFITLRINKS
jgi:SAM-dependent methyltransferase